jgi:hypothetical protein
VFDPVLGREVDLTGEKLDIRPMSVSWSPDGALVAFCGQPYGAAWDEWNLYVADPHSGAVSLVADRCGPWMSAWEYPMPWLPPAAPRGDD